VHSFNNMPVMCQWVQLHHVEVGGVLSQRAWHVVHGHVVAADPEDKFSDARLSVCLSICMSVRLSVCLCFSCIS
jgi:hypothetical protein